VSDGFETCVVFMLGYPAVGKRTVGQKLADLLDGVLIDNQLIHHPVLALFRWDGKSPLPPEIWERTDPIRDTVLDAIEDLAPRSNSYVFTNCLEDGDWAAAQYDTVRSLAHRRSSLFLAVMLRCDVDEQVRRIDTPDRIALMKGSDPEGYRWHRQHVTLFQPAAEEVLHVDTTSTEPAQNAKRIYQALLERGLRPRER
jgi:shikimate kinase